MARMGRRWRRSVASDDFTGVSVPSGCGRRVSLKRRSRMDSVGFEENHLGGQHALDRIHDRRQRFQLRAFANVHHQRSALDLGGLPDQFGKVRNQFHRQVVHAVVAQILESLEDRGLARPAHAGDDDQFARRTAIGRGSRLDGRRRFGLLPS